jgi:glutamate dehydrogenase (NAD(P)+)
VDAVFQHRNGSILNYPGATNIANSFDALEADCDILIPAALENVINGECAAHQSQDYWREAPMALLHRRPTRSLPKKA